MKMPLEAKTMLRKISLFTLIVVLVSAVMSVSAAGTPNPDPAANGCFVDAALTTVNEGVAIPVTVKCVGIPVDNNVFGFQFGTSVTTGSFVGSTPTAYVPGEFTSAAVVNGVFVGENSLALYGVSRKLAEVVDTTDFTLGTLALTAVTNRGTGSGLTDADGSVAVTFVDATFKLSDNFGASLPGWLRTVNDATTAVNDIDLAWLNGAATVKSDSNALGNITNIVLNLGAKQYTATSITSYTTNLNMDDTYLYVENGSGVVGGSYAAAADSNNTLNIAVTADMWGHLNCSTAVVNLGDVGAAEDVDTVVGTSGSITLKAGDVDGLNGISNTDATIIGGDFGDTGAAINVLYEGNINLDTTVDILDLVHVGRNFGATAGSCS
jgi:hypothetical protein